MIETDVAPLRCVMTVRAVAAQAAGVRLFFMVAVDTCRCGLAQRLAGRVACAAVETDVRAGQRKFRLTVIELFAAEFDDVAVSTLVLRMAGVALRRSDTRQPTVKVLASTDICRDVHVTVQAQLSLARAVAAVMALGALLLVLLMRTGELARHQQCLRVDCRCTLWRQAQKQRGEQQSTSGTSHHFGGRMSQ